MRPIAGGIVAVALAAAAAPAVAVAQPPAVDEYTLELPDGGSGGESSSAEPAAPAAVPTAPAPVPTAPVTEAPTTVEPAATAPILVAPEPERRRPKPQPLRWVNAELSSRPDLALPKGTPAAARPGSDIAALVALAAFAAAAATLCGIAFWRLNGAAAARARMVGVRSRRGVTSAT